MSKKVKPAIDFVARIRSIKVGSALHIYGDTVRIRDLYLAYAHIEIDIIEGGEFLGSFCPKILRLEHPELVSANVYDVFDEHCEKVVQERFSYLQEGGKIQVTGRLILKAAKDNTLDLIITDDEGLLSRQVQEIDSGIKLLGREIVDLQQKELKKVKSVDVDTTCIEVVG